MDRRQALARHLLAHREQGYSIRYVLRRSARRYVLSLLMLTALILGIAFAPDPPLRSFCTLGCGMYIGALLRDVGWLLRIKKNWPFSCEVTDWVKVTSIAEGDASATQQAT